MNTIIQGVVTACLLVGWLFEKWRSLRYKTKFKQFELEIEQLSKHHSIKDMFASNIMSMVDSNEFLAMQIKDQHDRYIFANKTLRSMLFQNKPLNKIIGKNDVEIVNDTIVDDDDMISMIDGLQPEDLENIDQKLMATPTRICNLTDVITKSFRAPCRFFEIVDGLALDVYKCPVYNQYGDIIATAGSLVDITEHRIKKVKEVEQLVLEGKAFPIGKTHNFYLLRDYCDVFTCF